MGEELRDTAASLLLVTHVAIRNGPRGPQIDDQTAAGIAQWCRHFEKVTYFGIADEEADGESSSSSWVDIADKLDADRCELVALPRAYKIGGMLREYRQVRVRLADAVSRHRHLCFTFGGLVGDWPAIAAREAIAQKRNYGAWIDRVEPLVIRNSMHGASAKRKIAATVTLPLIEHNIRYLLRKSSVALLQGLDTFEHYQALSQDPHCTYDTHTQISDEIAPDVLLEKKARILGGAPINILYVGRAAAMKGPGDWLSTLERIHGMNVPFRATWIGDGPELPMMRERIAASAISEFVHLAGFESNRETLLQGMRSSDMFLFCHKTPESPRCLIEALVSGCPLVGYETAYPRGLVQKRGGAMFAPQDDHAALADQIARLHKDRFLFAELVSDAAASGQEYNEAAVYEHRANLMKRT